MGWWWRGGGGGASILCPTVLWYREKEEKKEKKEVVNSLTGGVCRGKLVAWRPCHMLGEGGTGGVCRGDCAVTAQSDLTALSDSLPGGEKRGGLRERESSTGMTAAVGIAQVLHIVGAQRSMLLTIYGKHFRAAERRRPFTVIASERPVRGFTSTTTHHSVTCSDPHPHPDPPPPSKKA